MGLAKDSLLEMEEDTGQGRYLVFVVENEALGVEIEHVKEIISIQPITQVPGTPAHVRGIINLRGQIIPVIDMRLRFSKTPQSYTERTCIIVAEAGRHLAGLIVDKVTEVLPIKAEDISRPLLHTHSSEDCVKGISKADGQIKLLIDAEKLLSKELLPEK